MTPTPQSIKDRFSRDITCTLCSGTGKTGRNYCSECHGNGIAVVKHPRVQFSWGFHDATHDMSVGRPRQVSMEVNYWYALGYAAGLSLVPEGTSMRLFKRPESAKPAWIAITGFDE